MGVVLYYSEHVQLVRVAIPKRTSIVEVSGHRMWGNYILGSSLAPCTNHVSMSRGARDMNTTLPRRL